MSHLLVLVHPLVWLLVFLVLVLSVSYLYITNKNAGKIAIGLCLSIALIGGWSYGKILAQHTPTEQVR